MIKRILISFIILIFTGCGYTATEEDKYPEMAVFPEVNGVGISFIKQEIDFNQLHKLDDKFVSFIHTKDYNYALILDDSFTVKDKLPIGSDKFHFNHDGWVYYVNDDNKYEKVNLRTYERKGIPRFSLDLYDYYVKELNKIKAEQSKQPIDSIRLNIREQEREAYDITIAMFRDSIVPHLGCIKITRDSYMVHESYLAPENSSENYEMESPGIVAAYKGIEYTFPYDVKGYQWIEDDYYYHSKLFNAFPEDFPDCDSYNELYDVDYNLDDSKFTVFDTAVIENGGSGNHFVFSFHPIGYEYIEMNYKGEKVKFKLYNKDLKTFSSKDNSAFFVYETDRAYDNNFYKLVLTGN